LLFGGQADLLPHLVSAHAFLENGNWGIASADVERLRKKTLGPPARGDHLLALERR